MIGGGHEPTASGIHRSNRSLVFETRRPWGVSMKTRQSLTLTLAALFVASVFTSSALAEEDEGSSWTPEERVAFRARQSPLPLQAAVCDIIGIGTVTDISTNQWTEVAHLSVSNYWIGDPGSNTLSISANKLLLPVSSTQIVFFATSYALPHYYLGSEQQFGMLFTMPTYRQSRQSVEPRFYDDERSWFYATSENASLVAFASNLVVSAQISTNRMAYYEVIRDGFRLNPPESRIHIDSEVSFINSRHWMPTNFMQQIWSDPLLPNEPRADVNNSFMMRTGHWLP